MTSNLRRLNRKPSLGWRDDRCAATEDAGYGASVGAKMLSR